MQGGVLGQTRTGCLQFRKPALCPDELREQVVPSVGIEPTQGSCHDLRAHVRHRLWLADAIVDPWTRQVYANLGVELPDGATHADAERACAEWTATEDAA